jgi:hypothetical protein
MARRLGVHRSCVGHWEGVTNANPGPDKLASIATLCVISYEWLATGRGSMKLGHDPRDDIPAAHGMLVYDAQTIRLLEAWEAMSQRSRVGILEVVEEFAALRQPKRSRMNTSENHAESINVSPIKSSRSH